MIKLVGGNNVLGGKLSTATSWRQYVRGNGKLFFCGKVEPTRLAQS